MKWQSRLLMTILAGCSLLTLVSCGNDDGEKETVREEVVIRESDDDRHRDPYYDDRRYDYYYDRDQDYYRDRRWGWDDCRQEYCPPSYGSIPSNFSPSPVNQCNPWNQSSIGLPQDRNHWGAYGSVFHQMGCVTYGSHQYNSWDFYKYMLQQWYSSCQGGCQYYDPYAFLNYCQMYWPNLNFNYNGYNANVWPLFGNLYYGSGMGFGNNGGGYGNYTYRNRGRDSAWGINIGIGGVYGW